MKWALVDENNICQNIVAYDGVSLYTPPTNYTLQQINDWVEIGRSINESQPSPYVAPLETRRTSAKERLKLMRDSKLTASLTYKDQSFYCDDASMNYLSQCFVGDFAKSDITNINVQAINVNVFSPGISVFPMLWQTTTGAVMLSLNDAKGLLQAYLTRKQAGIVRHMALLAIINASNNPEAVDINDGWN